MLVAGATGGVGQLATAKLLEVRQRHQQNRMTTERFISCAVGAMSQTFCFSSFLLHCVASTHATEGLQGARPDPQAREDTAAVQQSPKP